MSPHAETASATLLRCALTYRKAGHVKRNHTQLTIRTQNVAEHSYGVAHLVESISGGTASKALIMAALQHDVAEQVTGDIPQPFKAWNPNVDKVLNEYEKAYEQDQSLNTYILSLSEMELNILKCADLMDYLFFVAEEVAMGNRYYAKSVDRVIALTLSYAKRLPETMLAAAIAMTEAARYTKIGTYYD